MSQNSVLSRLKIGVIGAGNMGGALIRGLIEKNVYPQRLWVFDVDEKKTAAIKKEFSVKVSKSARQCVSLSDVVILAVKPQIFAEVAEDIASSLRQEALVISIAAGVLTESIRSYLKKPQPIVRVMPNMPALVGAGISAFSLGKYAGPKHRKIAEAVLCAFGEHVQVPEKMLDLVTAISGSGPAYFFLLCEKMIEAAYEMGMKVDVAKKLVYHTAFGSGKVLLNTEEDPEELIAKVASKGGTTEAALAVFRKNGFGKILQDAVKAAHRRSVELSQTK